MESFSKVLVAMFIAITSIAVSSRSIGRFPAASRAGKYIRKLVTLPISLSAVLLSLILGFAASNAAAQFNSVALAIHIFSVGQGGHDAGDRAATATQDPVDRHGRRIEWEKDPLRGHRDQTQSDENQSSRIVIQRTTS